MGGETQRDRITATVRYEDGQEQYTQVTINGKPGQAAMLGSASGWSQGEFAQDLLAVFAPQSAAQFKFSKQESLHSSQALVFEFRVKQRNNHLRYLQSMEGHTVFPGYHGRLWIDQSTSHLMRLERKVDDVPADFAIQRADLVIDYCDVDLADGTRFVLPEQAVNVSCPGVASSHCWHNQLTFKLWHKFAARARILTSAARAAGTDTGNASQGDSVARYPSRSFVDGNVARSNHCGRDPEGTDHRHRARTKTG